MLNSCLNNVLVTDIICLIFNPVFSETVKLVNVILKVQNKTVVSTTTFFIFCISFIVNKQKLNDWKADKLVNVNKRERHKRRQSCWLCWRKKMSKKNDQGPVIITFNLLLFVGRFSSKILMFTHNLRTEG